MQRTGISGTTRPSVRCTEWMHAASYYLNTTRDQQKKSAHHLKAPVQVRRDGDKYMHRANDIGALFKNRKGKSPKSPNLTGTLELTAQVVMELAKRLATGQPAVLHLAAWRNTATGTGDKYLTIKAQLPFEAEPAAVLPFDDDDPTDF